MHHDGGGSPGSHPAWDPRSLVEAAPDLALAGVALLTWIRPEVLGTERVGYFILLMLLEFIVVHSAGFMGAVALGSDSPRRRITGTLGLGAFYSLFLVGFSLSFGKWWPLVAFWALTLNRLLGVLLGRTIAGEARLYLRRGWAAGAIFYLLGAFVTVLLPLPRLGITRAVVGTLDLPGSGLWISQPHRAVAFAALYFGMMGVSELLGHRWLRAGDLPRD